MRLLILFVAASYASTARAQFLKGEKPHAVFVVGTHHYSPQLTMPKLAQQLSDSGFDCTVILADGDPEHNPDGIGDLSALEIADVAIFYCRFLTLPDSQWKQIMDYLESKKPVVGIRTSTHAFDYEAGHKRESWNQDFGKRVVGSGYKVHLQGTTKVAKIAAHPILDNVVMDDSFTAAGTLYISEPPAAAKVILAGTGNSKKTGTIENRFGTHELRATMTSPVAWTWENEWGGRVFGTTLGHPNSFADPEVVRLFINGIYWAADEEIPTDFEPTAIEVKLPSKRKK
ncbi:MAG: ThuA domain-containing protein [Planctomycetota bacterium]